MSNRFISDWSRDGDLPLSKKITEKLHPTPMREKISSTIFRLNKVQKKLDDSQLRMERKHKNLFNKCVNAQASKNSAVAIMYANECAQLKQMVQTIITSNLALEQVALRLETVKDFGDVAAEVVPAAAVIQNVKGRLAGVMPDVSMQLSQIGHVLDNLMLEVGETTSQTWSSIASGEDSEKILAEASAIAEQKVRAGFPLLPTTDSVERGVNQS